MLALLISGSIRITRGPWLRKRARTKHSLGRFFYHDHLDDRLTRGRTLPGIGSPKALFRRFGGPPAEPASVDGIDLFSNQAKPKKSHKKKIVARRTPPPPSCFAPDGTLQELKRLLRKAGYPPKLQRRRAMRRVVPRRLNGLIFTASPIAK